MDKDNEEQDAEAQFVDVYPPPPIYYRLYGATSNVEPPLPPKPIENDSFQSFGQTLSVKDIIARPSDHNVKELFQEADQKTHVDRIRELKKMNRSLLFNYLELLNLLIESPTAKIEEDKELAIITETPEAPFQQTKKFAWEVKINQIQLIMINISYLLNSYRPHQSREQLIVILKEQLNRRQTATKIINDCVGKCCEVLKQAADVLDQNSAQEEPFNPVDNTNANNKKRKRSGDDMDHMDEDSSDNQEETKKPKDEIAETNIPQEITSLFQQIKLEVNNKSDTQS
ncbi:mediator of RNA polymerase II transcription subunit 7 [Acrasis kona]|uniref:Mediator of RNA polymerase II transcription subunit 7 n=1 Tax=Acrasis kona TaxID=1008807 RepID=A0AAW2ZJI1_9EUKA